MAAPCCALRLWVNEMGSSVWSLSLSSVKQKSLVNLLAAENSNVDTGLPKKFVTEKPERTFWSAHNYCNLGCCLGSFLRAFTPWLLRCFCRTDRKHCFHNIPARKINVNSQLWRRGQESQALGLQSQPTCSQFSLGFCLERKSSYQNFGRALVYFYFGHEVYKSWSCLAFCCVVVFVCSQFSSVAQSCPTLCDLMDCSTAGLPDHHQLPEPTQTHVHWVSDAIQPSHLCVVTGWRCGGLSIVFSESPLYSRLGCHVDDYFSFCKCLNIHITYSSWSHQRPWQWANCIKKLVS